MIWTIRNVACAAVLLVAACGNPPAAVGDRCATNADCPAASTCFGGTCRDDNGGGYDAGSNRDAGAGVDTGSNNTDTGTPAADAGAPRDSGSQPQDAGDQCQNQDCPCESEEDCPYTHYCNRRDGQCAPLPAGTCRDDRSCIGTCNVPAGRTVGRCVDCQVDADCAPQAPRTRCLNNTCRLPDGQCENNGDCANGENCVDGACVGGGGGGCNANNCPPPGQCVQNQCIGGGGQQGDCVDHSDCGAGQQCLNLQGMTMCMEKCNEGLMGALCALPNFPACICTLAGLTCNLQSGLCE